MRSFVLKLNVIGLAVAAFSIGLVAILTKMRGVSSGQFTRDVAAVADVSPVFGFLSTGGIILWALAAGVWLLFAIIAHSPEEKRFAAGSFLLTMYLCFDDAFMWHEYLAPEKLGLSEKFALVILVVAVLLYGVTQATILLKTPVISAAAFGFLALGAGSDFAIELAGFDEELIWPWYGLIEDGFKFIGIIYWGILALTHAHYNLLPSQTERPA